MNARVSNAAWQAAGAVLVSAVLADSAYSAGAAATTAAPPPAAVALFQPGTGALPYPTDLDFIDSTDGTVNIQPPPAQNGAPAGTLTSTQVAINALDGFSTTSVIRESFSEPLNPASINAAGVRMLEVDLDNVSKDVIGVRRQLQFGVDFTADIATDAGSNSTILELRPVKPLVPSSGRHNVGYVVALTNTLRARGGGLTVPDAAYTSIVNALQGSGCKGLGNSPLRTACLGVQSQRTALLVAGIDPNSTILTFSFSTESISDTFQALAAPGVTVARPVSVVNTGLTTQDVDSSLPGHATLYKGTLQIPYYLTAPTSTNPIAPLTTFWEGGPSPLDSSSTFLTRFNPLPLATTTLEIPILIAVPNSQSAGGGRKPPGGWPVVIFQHGLTRNRMDAIQIADAFADGDSTVPGSHGSVVVAIDLPLHGIAGADAVATNPFYDAAHERTFNLDLINNTTGASGPDGIPDPSGTYFVNLNSLLTSRDNLREGVIDLLTLVRSLQALQLGSNAGPALDATNIHFVGHSLGAIVGGVFLGSPESESVRTGELANPGGDVATVIFDSPAFAPEFDAQLAAQGIQTGTTAFADFVRDAQTAVDAGDPSNYILCAVTHHPLLMFQVIGGGIQANGQPSPPDQTVVNSTTGLLINTAGLPRLFRAGVNPGRAGFVNFIFGVHDSLIDPTTSPATTAEMQRESVSFAASQGNSVTLTDTTVIEP